MKNYIIHRTEEGKICRVSGYDEEKVSIDRIKELLENPENIKLSLVESPEMKEFMEYFDEREDITKDFKTSLKEDMLHSIDSAIRELENIRSELYSYGEK